VNAEASSERARRLEVLKQGVDVALKTLSEYNELLAQTVDDSFRSLTTDQVRNVMMVLEYVAEGSAYNAYVNGVEVQEWARRLYKDLHAEFPDIEP
jgi:hypothetical protein